MQSASECDCHSDALAPRLCPAARRCLYTERVHTRRATAAVRARAHLRLFPSMSSTLCVSRTLVVPIYHAHRCHNHFHRLGGRHAAAAPVRAEPFWQPLIGTPKHVTAKSPPRPEYLKDLPVNPEEADIVLLEKVTPMNGRAARIVFSTTSAVDVMELEDLGEKVGWPRRPAKKMKHALEHSFLVATLYMIITKPKDQVAYDAAYTQAKKLKKEKIAAAKTGATGASTASESGDGDGGVGAVGDTENDDDASLVPIGSYPEVESRRRLIGLTRATSDHVFNATLWDIIICPQYQGQGLGRAIVELCIRTLHARDIANVTLFADRDVVPFYAAMGFVQDPDGIKGMFLHPK